jgi:YGGT family
MLSTVTEPYLRVFRSVIPPIGGFDISALPAIFCLDILGQTAVAVGAEFPAHMKKGQKKGIQEKPIRPVTEGKSSRNNFRPNNWGFK